jgi:hypothetical protein
MLNVGSCGGKSLRFLNFALDEGEWPGFTLRPLYFRVENLGGHWLGGFGVDQWVN